MRDARDPARIREAAWYVARENGAPQSNPAHLSNCMACYDTETPARHVEESPTWTPAELRALLTF